MRPGSRHKIGSLFAYILLGVWLAIAATPARAATVQRPIEDFLSTQGMFCIHDGTSDCLLFFPPDPNLLGWANSFDSPMVFFASVDYAGIMDAYPSGVKPEISGTVSERPLPDGRAEVTVLLRTKHANVWVIELAGDPPNNPTLFGHRPGEVVNGAGQAFGDSVLHVVFINTAPGAPLPDLVRFNIGDLEPGQELKFIGFTMTATGPLTSAFGVPEGTLGKCTIAQTGLVMTHGQGRGVADGFPAESILLKQVGK